MQWGRSAWGVTTLYLGVAAAVPADVRNNSCLQLVAGPRAAGECGCMQISTLSLRPFTLLDPPRPFATAVTLLAALRHAALFDIPSNASPTPFSEVVKVRFGYGR